MKRYLILLTSALLLAAPAPFQPAQADPLGMPLNSPGAGGASTSLTATGITTLATAETGVIAFATGGQTSATLLSATTNFHVLGTVATAGDSVKLPPWSAGAVHYIANAGAAVAQVYGSGTDTINGSATASGVPLIKTMGAWFVAGVSGNWVSTFLTLTTSNGNQVVVTQGASGSYTLSTPQSTNTTANIQFGGLGIGVAASANAIKLPNGIVASTTAPSIASGFGSSPSIPNNNGTAAFTINVGTGGVATSGVVTMPTATTGWACEVSNSGAPQAASITDSAPTSATSITITNYTLTTGVALAWPASTVLQVICNGY